MRCAASRRWPATTCGWRATRSLYLASRRRDRRVLEQEWLARRTAGIELELLSERDIRERFSFSRPAALLSPVAGEVDAYRLTHKLLAEATAAGLEVYDRTPVVGYDSERQGVELRTSGGARVHARKAVFATGYETPEFLDRSLVRLLSTYAFATEPLDGSDGWGEDRCLIWETARPYFYARMIGRRPRHRGRRRHALRHRAQARRAPRQALPAARAAVPGDVSRPFAATRTGGGAGPSARRRDGLPYIGTARQFPHGYFALGYGGNGITFSWIAADILLDLFLGRPNPDAELFRFDRG